MIRFRRTSGVLPMLKLLSSKIVLIVIAPQMVKSSRTRDDGLAPQVFEGHGPEHLADGCFDAVPEGAHARLLRPRQ